MKADALSPRQMFDGNLHYEIPSFQRPYVWTEEDQWAPLWADIVRVAESRVAAVASQAPLPHHFLGAVVYESKPPVVGDVTRHLVIDGQQRTTTLQLVIDAVQAVIAERGHELLADDLEKLILNRASVFRGRPERFKLWPSKHDRDAFAQAMDPEAGWKGDHRILDAHAFFSGEARAWLTGVADVDGRVPPGSEAERAFSLSATLQDGLYLVAINLTGHDDSQLIFETLNDRGTPLLKADLIKNWVFQQGERVGADVDSWPDTHWVDFDEDWWRAEIAQGRLSRSRIDIFIQYWLTMRLSDEVKTEQVFRIFTEYAVPRMTDAAAAEKLLREFRRDADTYRSLSSLPEESVPGSFYRRVVETMELAATSPLLLWLLSANHDVPPDQVDIALDALESWVIRRTLIRMTMKDVNKMMVSILKLLDRTGVESAGDTVRSFLAVQTADARVWPTDQMMLSSLPSMKLYGYIRQSRLRIVLEAIERHLRTSFHEAVSLPSGLEIEHVMPRGWHAHWDHEPKLTPEESATRDQRVHTLGNLTLIAKSLNGSLSNRPWTDGEAATLKTGGEHGLGKRSLLEKYSLLVLSRELITEHPDGWSDEDIEARSVALTRHICAVWAPPPEGLAAHVVVGVVPPDQVGTPNFTQALPRVDWNETELEDFARGSTELTRRFLDHVASHLPGKPFLGSDFTDSPFAPAQIPGIAGAMAKRVYESYGRSNPIVEFIRMDGQWHYFMEMELASRWSAMRRVESPTTPEGK
ncbi:DUF262 domain-containing protein [Terrabacter ginsenosidimutans]|uniref:DUF262 domain-containing protein n=1 Tax=Terrabacter ginsenosidimutans TaxID=490575 RepID=A0ABP7CU19_9MICO